MFENWPRIKERFEALWQREIVDRCCVRVVSRKAGVVPEPTPFPESEANRMAYWLDGEKVLARELKRIESTYFAGEAFPNIFSNFGAAGHAAFFRDAKIQFRESIWIGADSEPAPGSGINLIFDPDSLLLKKTFEVIHYLVEESRGRYFVSMPDISGNLDALAHLRTSATLLVDFMLQPEVVQQALDKMMRVWKNVSNEVFEIVRDNNDGGSTIGWLDTWAPGFHSQMQADISVMISPEMFTQFALPELTEQSKFLEFPLYHLDGQEQIRHLDNLLAIEDLKMIQWTNVAGQPSPVEFISIFKRIQEAGKCLLIRLNHHSEIKPIMTELSSNGLYLYLEPTLDSPDEADAVVKMVERLTHD